MHEREGVALSEFTTLRVGGRAARFVAVETEPELCEVIRAADARREPILVLGEGSNVVVGDAGFAGTVVHVRTRGVAVQREGDRALVDVAAGEPWDGVVARAVDEGLSGIECLSGIPGYAGATPVQNVGAYGQEVGERLVTVRTYDRTTGTIATLPAAACGFGYRTSIFKHRERYVVTGVRFALPRSDESAPVRYAELARALGIAEGSRAPLRAVRDAVIALRRGKGMVLDAGDPESASAGSFFVNPVVSRAVYDEVAQRAGERPAAFAESDGRMKLAAAWLVERAGFAKGFTLGRAGVSRKHALAIVNRGGASAREVLDVARQIRAGVHARFGVRLEAEPVLVGCTIDA